MLTSLVLDALLVLIVVMMVPLGFLRGGLRELSTSAALLLGILMAENWADRWSSVFTRWTTMGEGAARFAMAVVIVVGITGVVGYGGSAAFSWKPGPGGRGYGAYLALLNAMLFIGFLINRYIRDIFDGQVPETIDRATVSRALSVGFEWVLLLGTIGILIATVFGMFVRERGDDESYVAGPSPEELYHVRYEPPRAQVRPLNDPQETQVSQPVPPQPVRIREVRHWEDEESDRVPENTYGSGWRQTWPEDRKAPSRPHQPGAPSPGKPETPRSSSGSQRDVLRDWMRSEKDRPDRD